jgi:hypothetical protein
MRSRASGARVVVEGTAAMVVDVVEVLEAVVVGAVLVVLVPMRRLLERVVAESAACPEHAARVRAAISAASAGEFLAGFSRGPRLVDLIMQRSSHLRTVNVSWQAGTAPARTPPW